jgi:hypothetical protein
MYQKTPDAAQGIGSGPHMTQQSTSHAFCSTKLPTPATHTHAPDRTASYQKPIIDPPSISSDPLRDSLLCNKKIKRQLQGFGRSHF